MHSVQTICLFEQGFACRGDLTSVKILCNQHQFMANSLLFPKSVADKSDEGTIDIKLCSPKVNYICAWQ